ncbi:MAG TPA: hypothetical protein PKL04_00800 [Methanofastidiosum sp.]|mgnify:CR=1 FL=1|nr:hypothetical protein [Methanofastidiosum sp.]
MKVETRYYSIDDVEFEDVEECADHELKLKSLGRFVLIDIFTKEKRIVTHPVWVECNKYRYYDYNNHQDIHHADYEDCDELSQLYESHYLVIPESEYNHNEVENFLSLIEKWKHYFGLKRKSIKELAKE